MDLLLALARPALLSVQSALALIVLLIVAGIVWKFLEPYIAEPFRSFVVIVIVGLFCLALLTWAGWL